MQPKTLTVIHARDPVKKAEEITHFILLPTSSSALLSRHRRRLSWLRRARDDGTARHSSRTPRTHLHARGLARHLVPLAACAGRGVAATVCESGGGSIRSGTSAPAGQPRVLLALCLLLARHGASSGPCRESGCAERGCLVSAPFGVCWSCAWSGASASIFSKIGHTRRQNPQKFLASQGRTVTGPQIGPPLAVARDARPVRTCGGHPPDERRVIFSACAARRERPPREEQVRGVGLCEFRI